MKWESNDSNEEWLLLGMFSNPLHINQLGKDLAIYSSELLIKFHNYNSHQLYYWRIVGAENDDGEDFLELFEQEAPYPFKYELTEGLNGDQDHIIVCSSFTTEHDLITSIQGYGFDKDGKKALSTIVLRLEPSYVIIHAGPVLKIQVTDQEPEMLDEELHFSSLN
ncbi:hypothetical protein [Alkalibacillus almallahensis]|uniref:hypothetical protein n=1 Tax=Alkalibacillus almallahensis TaxID=1379154 RepID=UPI00142201EB|nr:hypothetical protein [Alkalibacillus almallahensis]NIK11527.1 hypothetical protein [Alkalibacillus almallahensis]